MTVSRLSTTANQTLRRMATPGTHGRRLAALIVGTREETR
jgi:hypothetical protein